MGRCPSPRAVGWLVLLAGAVLASACSSGTAPAANPNQAKQIAIITPSHDNPFFKAEGETAAARARALG
jgi:erythritol transport system substrate-binding protein